MSGEKKQSFHKVATPRAGGISIYVSSLFFSSFISSNLFISILCFLPAFLYGLYEDIYGDTPQKNRLFVMAICTIFAMFFTDITIKSAGFFDIPLFIQYPLTIIGVLGIASAINFIDGLNGLASGVSLIALLFIGVAALLGNNYELAYSMFLLSASIVGFMVFNFPLGKIFLGDAGAYFLGYILAFSAESLAYNGSQSSEISPWFLVALFGYPIIETIYTMLRRYNRLKKEKIKFFEAETVHLHSLVYLNVLKNNWASSFLILSVFSVISMISFQFKDSHVYSIVVFALSIPFYLLSYNFVKNFSEIKASFIKKEKSLSYQEHRKNKKSLSSSLK
ncbi:MAG: MraY family glycosyltransferase [Cyanobacteriota bacterium]